MLRAAHLDLDDGAAAAHRADPVKAALSWSGWGSPIGLGFLLVAVGVFLVCLHLAGMA